MSGGEHWKSAALVEKYLKGMRAAIPFAAEQIEVMARLIAATGIPVRRTLDLGCGSGILSAAIRQRFPDVQQTLVDFSEPMLEEAARALPDAVIVRGNLNEPSWRDGVEGPFDAIVSGLAAHHFTDDRKRAFYTEIFELLSPGAIFVHIDHTGSASKWLESIWYDMFADGLQRQNPGMTREKVVAEYLGGHDDEDEEDYITDVETQCNWLREVGYTDVDTYFRVLDIAVFGGRRP